jgi:hypothetical protein
MIWRGSKHSTVLMDLWEGVRASILMHSRVLLLYVKLFVILRMWIFFNIIATFFRFIKSAINQYKILKAETWSSIILSKNIINIVGIQYSETNVMLFLFSLLRIKGLYMFRAFLAYPQEEVHKQHTVYCVRVNWSSADITCTPYTKRRLWSASWGASNARNMWRPLILNKLNKKCITLV